MNRNNSVSWSACI